MQQVVSADGTTIGYWRSGSGPPLVLVHGTTADHTRWSRVLPQLEPHFTVYAMDRRGRGASGDAPDYDLVREGEDVAAVVDAVGGPVFVLGHSYGARCSLEAALLTDNIRRLILYEPPIPVGPPAYPRSALEGIQALVDRGELEAGLELFFREVVRMPEQELQAFRRLPMWRTRTGLTPTIPREMALDWGYDFHPERFASFDVPTLLFLGGDSPPVFRQAVEMANSVLPDSRVVVFPGQRHVAMDTAPELFVSEVLRFLLE